MTKILTKEYILSNMLRIYFANVQDGQKKLGNLQDKDLAAYIITNAAFSAHHTLPTSMIADVNNVIR